MTALAVVGPSPLAGAGTVGAIQWRTSWRTISTWVLGLAAALAGTTVALHASYDTPAKIAEYARAAGSGDALVAVNGRVAGLDTLGGVIANEFGFVAAFALPLMGISLMARLTRGEEEAGRADLVAVGRVGRAAPLAAASVTTFAAILVTSAVFAACLAVVGVGRPAAVLYAASLGALAACFAGVAALAAQMVAHTRGVYAVGLGILAVAYLVRGVGDVLRTWLVWLSPLGWAERTEAFGARHWWPLVIPLIVGAGCLLVALRYAAGRDVGSALLPPRPLAPHATHRLRRPLGLALRQGRDSVLAWSVGAVLVAAMFGSLTHQASDAISQNAALARGLGGEGVSGADILLRLDLVLVALLVAAAGIQRVGAMRSEEVEGRLEVALSGPDGRGRWLAARGAALLIELTVVGLCGTIALCLSTAWSLDEWSQVPRVAGAAAAHLVAVLALVAAAFALFAVVPRLFALAWVWFTATAFVALLGPAVRLPDRVAWFAPTDHVGDLPGGATDTAGLVGLGVLVAVLVVAAAVGFRRRDIR